MTLNEVVQKQVIARGNTLGGQRLAICNLLDHGQDIFQFMQLFTAKAIESFYYGFAAEIDTLCAEDEILPTDAGICEYTKLAVEKTLMLIEGELKNANNNSHTRTT